LRVLYLSSGEASTEEEALLRDAAGRFEAAFSVVEQSGGSAASTSREEQKAPLTVIVGAGEALRGAGSEIPGASLVLIAEPGEATAELEPVEERISSVLRRPLDLDETVEALRRAGKHASLLSELQELRKRVEAQGQEVQELNRIGVALSAERNTNTLLDLILTKCREITCSDAGSLYLVEPKEGKADDERDYFADKVLVFRLAQNDSVDFPLGGSGTEVSWNSLAGWVAQRGRSLNIEDAYAISGEAEYHFNREIDASIGYRTKSLLVIPMRNHKEEMIGVLQLINRKKDRHALLRNEESVARNVVPYGERTTGLARSLASQAAVAIENARLYEEIQALFEGFIKASVTAIESRDPTTSGHSGRVADLTVDLAEKVDRESTGLFRETRFNRDHVREIKYASLLHDFGKIGVRENVLLKGKKLFDNEIREIRDRFALIGRGLELKYSREKIRYLMEKSREEALAACADADTDLGERIEELERYLAVILEANEPTVLKEEASSLLQVVAGKRVAGVDGEPVPLLEAWEFANLSIGRGSLSPGERKEIESHVSHTFQFLKTIPWTRELGMIPQIAGAHHEKLDGSGYPRRITVERIPLQSKMMTISDIFDALTANDRPYKRAMPAHKALDILTYEVKEGKVDPELFRIFVEGKVYEVVLALARTGTG
jgi:HD-GYP domain-containing protein (c-di-GMP phosphodiesterase class II)